MNISSISTGFIEIPDQISINIYVQGCKNNCLGCQNPELKEFDIGTNINQYTIIDIIESKPIGNWICWLGGDATYQPDDFIIFNQIFKSLNKKICLYTGRYFTDIKNMIEDVDLVVDGPWVEELGGVNSENTNQKVYFKNKNNEWINIKFKEISQYIKE
jgi:anaerobic ribonucleoside-triphosphate reductase activating protein